MTQTKTLSTTKNQELEPASNTYPAAANNLLPGLGLFSSALPGLMIDYRRIEIRLNGGQTSIHGERKTLQDGQITAEQFDLSAPAEIYIEALEAMQNQMNSMIQATLTPWALMMWPFQRASENEN
ncbi:MAG: hypothetical protein CMI01_03595 [Oceanospirillaceae bacterium]|nr:hypothetical protein [Oceanospirillaceae bacterium]